MKEKDIYLAKNKELPHDMFAFKKKEDCETFCWYNPEYIKIDVPLFKLDGALKQVINWSEGNE
jgi:hypothetical protein